jgi:c-di-AMP phosphodiesterase-like protein
MRKKRNNYKQDILFILISSFILVVVWICFNLYHIWITSTISQDIQVQMIPIDANFDNATIQNVLKREYIEPLFESQEEASSPALLAPEPLGVANASDAAQLTPSVGQAQVTKIQ